MSIIEFNAAATPAARVELPQRGRSSKRLSRLAGMILLAGGLRPAPLAHATQRSLLDLPVDAEHTLLDLWHAHAAILAASADLGQLPLRVVTNWQLPLHKRPAFAVPCTIERDPSDLRGSGGVLHDIAEKYDDDDLLLVINAHQILYEALAHLVESLAATGAEVSMLAQGPSTPSGVMLVKCGALRNVPDVGYIDLKEKALPSIAREHAVKVVRREGPVALPVRTAGDYLAALRRYHRNNDDGGAFSEQWSSRFGIAERFASVEQSARLHDSVVLTGGRVERGALVARSVICPGAVVRHGEVVVDQIRTAPAARLSRAV